ncbi:MAG TPA: NUDIX domain-containing protein [Aestuariivirga sp.]|nr:NUDIX domain-containing protein [Aestuariivirga sp.]
MAQGRGLKRALFRAASVTLLHPFYRQVRGMTLGVRVVVLEPEDGAVLLVRHSYAPGWIFPGGGVERGEAIAEAARREVREEAGIVPEGDMALHGVFLNDAQFRGDHVAVLVVRAFSRQAWQPTAEIREARFFPVTALPEGASAGTVRRLDEIRKGLPAAERW